MVAVASALALQTATPTPGVAPDELVDFWPPIIRAAWFLGGFLLVVGVGWYVLEPTISRIIQRRNRNNPTLQEAMSRYVHLLVVLIAVLTGAGIAGFGKFLSNSALIIAAGTIAVGVAGQTVFGSIVSGLVLVVDPEFNVDNYIEWGEYEGVIESITLRVTRIQTPDGELVTIPNTALTDDAISRPYGRGRNRIVERVGIDYDADVAEALKALRDVASDVEGVLDDPEPSAYVEEFGSDAIVVRVHYWVGDPRHHDIFDIRSTYARRAKERLEDAGITVSPPS